jgi:hypothetical protein
MKLFLSHTKFLFLTKHTNDYEHTSPVWSVLVSQVLKFYVSISEFPFLRIFAQMAAWNLNKIAHNMNQISTLEANFFAIVEL